MKYTTVNDEVLYTDEKVTTLSSGDMDSLAAMASENERKRIRLCTHENAESVLHEMFIIHERGAYVRPHGHRTRDESFHVLSGKADIVIFDEVGKLTKVIHLGDYASGKDFYCRLPKQTLHMVIIRSEVLVFCEATLGPFNPDDVVYPDWAPADGHESVWEYVADVTRQIKGLD